MRRIFAAIRIRIYLLSVKSIEQRTVPEGKLESFTKFAGNRRPTFLARSFVTRGHHYRQQPPLIYYGNFSTDTTNIWSDYVSGVLLFMYVCTYLCTYVLMYVLLFTLVYPIMLSNRLMVLCTRPRHRIRFIDWGIQLIKSWRQTRFFFHSIHSRDFLLCRFVNLA